jgi:hypothetical protein
VTETDAETEQRRKTRRANFLGKAATDLVAQFEEKARLNLENWEEVRPKWAPDSAPKELEEAIGLFRAVKEKLAQDTPPDEAGHWLALILDLVHAVNIVTRLSVSGWDADNQQQYQGGLARDAKRAKKAGSEKEIALNKAIADELIARPSARPRKEFVRGVNRRLNCNAALNETLEAQGEKVPFQVTKYAIEPRLKKMMVS